MQLIRKLPKLYFQMVVEASIRVYPSVMGVTTFELHLQCSCYCYKTYKAFLGNFLHFAMFLGLLQHETPDNLDAANCNRQRLCDHYHQTAFDFEPYFVAHKLYCTHC